MAVMEVTSRSTSRDDMEQKWNECARTRTTT